MKTIALILIDPAQGCLGHEAQLGAILAGQPVLQHTIDRVTHIAGIDEVLLAVRGATDSAGAEDRVAQLGCAAPAGKKVRYAGWSLKPDEVIQGAMIAAGRKWSLTGWRGGIGGMTSYDELLPAGPVLRLLEQHDADAAVVVRGDWCVFDPALASEQLEVYRSAPESMKLVFSQAPPGLGALVVDRLVLEGLAQHRSTIAQLLCYNPEKPALDPISRDVCVAVPTVVRDRHRRFIYDTPRSAAHLQDIAGRLGQSLRDADAEQIAACSLEVDSVCPERQLDRLPPYWTIELTPQRPAHGPITPQHHLPPGGLPRKPMDTARAVDLVQQLGAQGDVSVMLGGLGDALEHDGWLKVVEAAHDAGVMGIGIETDLLCDDATIEQLRDAPVDAVSVRINADTAAVYEQLMGVDGFKTVLDNLQSLYAPGSRYYRGARDGLGNSGGGFGWIVPRLIKVADNLRDMETFFERWMRLAGWAVIDRFDTGRGLIPDLGPVPMQPPRPPGYAPPVHRQKRNLTVLSDGALALCGQDWLGRAALGNVADAKLIDLWRGTPRLSESLIAVEADEHAVCERCQDWLAVQQPALATTSSL